MNSSKNIAETFRKIQEDKQNTICFDCGHNDVTHASVSLGILLCKGCATVHKALIPEISEIKVIDNSYSMTDLESLIMGGNASLKSFFAMYSISCNDSIEYKYRTKACTYYKHMLQMMVGDTPCTMLTPSQSEGAELNPEYSEHLYSDNDIEQRKTEGNEIEEKDVSPILKAIKSVEVFTSDTFSSVKTKALGLFERFSNKS
jgi:hypothetical protein